MNNRPQFLMLSNRQQQSPIIQYRPQPRQPQAFKPNIQYQLPENKMKWGEPVWLLFHTLAHKIKDEEFDNIGNQLIQFIIQFCRNLPCPTCASHATTYLSKINLSLINTKDRLKRLLFDFHNTVNQNKSYPLFEFENLDDKYENANTNNIIYNFFNKFNSKQFNVNLITDNMQRDIIIKKFKEWLTVNISKFDA